MNLMMRNIVLNFVKFVWVVCPRGGDVRNSKGSCFLSMFKFPENGTLESLFYRGVGTFGGSFFQ
jgi:hypothetical protein